MAARRITSALARRRPMNEPRIVGVAASGGLDSTALLHCTARQARGQGIEVLALHVHHGLQPDADRWLAQLRERCARWRRGGLPVRLEAVRLEGGPARGDSVESWARRERYRALTAMAHQHGCSVVLLAHHRRDQAETFVLQALRGAGPAGLAAMPSAVTRGGVAWVRPWLDQPRSAIEAYARRHRIAFVEDPSNADPRFARSRLRIQVWPALRQAFPDAETTLCAAAKRAQEAQAALADYVAGDLQAVRDGAALAVPAWLALAPPRRAAVLRAWLDGCLAGSERAGTPQSLIERLLAELPGAPSSARWPAPGGALALHRGRLAWLPQAFSSEAQPEGPAELRLDLSRPGVVPVAQWRGAFHVVPAAAGVAPELLRDVVLRARQGGERFALAPRATPRSLKKQYQAVGTPAWDRAGPLVWAEGRLVCVPGLGIDGRVRTTEPGALDIRWVAGPG